MAFSPDSQILASILHDRVVRLWDANIGVSCSILEGYLSWVKIVAFSLDGQLLASILYDRIVRLWDTNMGASHGIFKGYSN